MSDEYEDDDLKCVPAKIVFSLSVVRPEVIEALKAEITALKKERDEYKYIHDKTVKHVFPGICDTPDAYSKMFRQMIKEVSDYREALEQIIECCNSGGQRDIATEVLSNYEKEKE